MIIMLINQNSFQPWDPQQYKQEGQPKHADSTIFSFLFSFLVLSFFLFLFPSPFLPGFQNQNQKTKKNQKNQNGTK